MFFEPGIATKLGCEDLETVTSEELALEASLNTLWLLLLNILTYGYNCEKLSERICCSSGPERNREVDESEENDGRSFSAFLGSYLLSMHRKICENFLGFLSCC